VIGPILDGTLVLAEGIFDPLAVTLEVEPAGLPEWCLAVEPSPARQVPSWPLAATRRTVPAIDRAALAAFVRVVASQEAEPGEAITPVGLRVTAVRARLGEAGADGVDSIEVRHAGGSESVAIARDARGAWIAGPTGGLLTSPIETYGRVLGRLAQLTVEARWSPWYEEGASGTAAIERAVAALASDGWRRIR
jgi:hypothetical protein